MDNNYSVVDTRGYVFPILLNGPLMFRSGGLGVSAVRRARFLSEGGGHPFILVNVLEPQLPGEVAKLEEFGRLGENTEVRSILHDFMDIPRKSKEPSGNPYRFPREKYDLQANATYSHLFHYYDGDVKVADENRGSVTNLNIISMLKEGKREQILYVDDSYNILRCDYLNSEGKTIRVEYRDRAGECFLYNEQVDGKIIRWVLKGQSWNDVVFKSEDLMVEYWLEEFNADILKDNVVITEWAYKHSLLQRVQKKLHCKFAIQFHNNHFAGNRRYGEVLGTLKNQIALASELGRIVVLTQEQKFDLLKGHPSLGEVAVIPHVIEVSPVQVERDPYKIVMISRFAGAKQIEGFLESFDRVLARVPEAKLELWGRGPLESEYERIIQEKGMHDSVKICGFTDNPLAVYAGAAISVFSSEYEGFNMSLAESVVCGTVPVSFDFKYGPRYAIEDGKTGLITDMNNFDELADAVALLLENQPLRESMSKAGLERMELLNSSENLCRSWVALYQDLGIKPHQIKVSSQ